MAARIDKLDIWFPADVVRILNAVAAAGAERGPEYRYAVEHIAAAFGVEDEVDLPVTIDAGYWVERGSDRD